MKKTGEVSREGESMVWWGEDFWTSAEGRFLG